jgi:thiol:disulfide interchange protein DsbC
MHRTRAILPTVVLLTASPGCLAADPAPFPAEPLLEGIEAMQRLPAPGFHLVESRGRLLLLASNGHYAVLGGQILDLWNRTRLMAVADVAASRRIPYRRIGIDPAELAVVSTGTGPEVLVFLDPEGRETDRLLAQVRALQAQHRFELAFLPARPERRAVSGALTCDEAAATQWLATGTLPTLTPCPAGEQRLARNLLTATLLGIDRVPFTIAPNGQPLVGVPDDYAAFLAANGPAAAGPGGEP